MKMIICFVAVLFTLGCDTSYSRSSDAIQYRGKDLKVRRVIGTLKPAGCWVDIYFEDGSKLWAVAPTEVCSQ